MMETYKQYLKPFLKTNLLPIMFWGGLVTIILGSIFGSTIDSWPFIPDGTGKALLNGGSAVLGAGVFGIILKTAQYTEIFQKNIMDVMYSPSNMKEQEPLIKSWKFLTNELLKHVLPLAYHDATNILRKKFLNDELDYHFENYNVVYDIDVTEDIATIRTTINANIVIASNRKEPKFEQELVNNGENKLLKLVINGQDILASQKLEPVQNQAHTYKLSFLFKEYGIIPHENDDLRIGFERVIEQTQDLRNDPCLFTLVRRYAKGFEVRAKVSDGYKLFFDTFSLHGLEDNSYWSNDGTGYEKWLLANPNDLLIPGDGFNIVILKNS